MGRKEDISTLDGPIVLSLAAIWLLLYFVAGQVGM